MDYSVEDSGHHEPNLRGGDHPPEDLDEMIAAQEKFLNVVGFESGSVQ